MDMDKQENLTTGTGETQAAIGGEETETLPADAGRENGSGEERETARLSWEEILADPAYKSRYDEAVQSIVRARLRGRREAEERLERLAPVLRALEDCYGLGGESDAEQIAASLRESAGLRRPSTREVAAHLDALLREAETLREAVPGFDLLRELEDPAFLRMTAPHSGISLRDAYYARHRAELQRETARRSLEAVSRSVRSLGMRPRELPDGERGAAGSDPRQMSRAEREALKKRIREEAAQGRKLEVGE